MTQETYATPLTEIARDHIGTIFSAYQAATGTPPSAAAKLIYGDPKFPTSFMKVSITVGTYDKFISRFSACWPQWADWPAAVPRQAPAEIPAADFAVIRAKQAKRAPTPFQGEWPADIPKPTGA